MSRSYDEDGRCRYCRQFDGEHRASCVLAPEPPPADEPAVDASRAAWAASNYQDLISGEQGHPDSWEWLGMQR